MDLTERLAALRSAYAARHPASAAQYEAACAHLPGGNTRSVLYYEPFPLAMVKGQGARLWDADGHGYTDFLGEFTAGLYGHSHPVIRAAIDSALDQGINLAGHTVLESRLAGLISARLPSMQRLRFTNSGTEANLMALAVAIAHTGRRRVLVFKGGYHGGVLTFANGGAAVNVPHEFIVGRYNDLARARALIDDNANHLAAILVEPMQGSGGCIPADPAFLRGLSDAAHAVGAMLIFDEVMTSRLSPGGLQGRWGITPDLTTLGKYIGGGMSFGAFGGRAEVMELFDPRRPGHLPHAGTFNNNVLTMSAGIAGLGQVYTPEAAIALNQRGDALRERLNALCRAQGAAMQFTGLGSLMNLHPTARAIERVDDLPSDGQAMRDSFFFLMLEQGFYLARRGFISLSLPLTDADLDAFAEAAGRVIETLSTP
ncbi:aminotransferase class III-fold pyridoxal phosphate-dependent enzyme [Ideonella sp. DXS29W]|uniref:Aminotransferase class III-fold pyridoxal phosphate-dependent enzyme n=1 Tax=Ideonella lacteola TaxID=2984193 RepID=A0ABU9BZ34_9BURK